MSTITESLTITQKPGEEQLTVEMHMRNEQENGRVVFGIFGVSIYPGQVWQETVSVHGRRCCIRIEKVEEVEHES